MIYVGKVKIFHSIYIPQALCESAPDLNFIIGPSQKGGQRFFALGNLFKDGKGKPVLSQHYIVSAFHVFFKQEPCALLAHFRRTICMSWPRLFKCLFNYSPDL